jgi:hypothetical protein
LVTDFKSTSDGRTRESSLSPKLWIRLFIDPSGALPNPIHARFIGARGGPSKHLVRDEVDDGLGLLRRGASFGGDAAPEVPQRRRREGAIATATACRDRRRLRRAGEAPGPALHGEDDDAGLHRAARWEAAAWWRLGEAEEAERTDSEVGARKEGGSGGGVGESVR